ncbi:MAG: hypothetical protein IJM44_07535, partial [Ruminococcus sp.]|nr:hypothetical protein [Ruminococcus sp.]
MNVKKNPGALNAAAFALSLAGGYVMCGTTVAGAASFVDISLCGALPLPLAAAVFTGAAVRSIVRRTVGRLIVKHAAMLLVVILKMFFEDRNDPRSCAAFTALGTFISGTAVSAVVGELMYKLPFYLVYAGVSALTAYCISALLTGIQTSRAVDLRGISGLYHALVYTVFAASLCTAAVTAVNAGVVLGAAATLTAAYFYGAGGGVTIGSLTACGAFLSSVSCGLSVVLLPAAGLAAGYLRRRRSVSAAGAFTAICLASQSVMGVSPGSGEAMLDIIAGAGLFLAVSPFFSDRWIISPASADTGLRELMTVRSGFLADSLSSVRDESERI